jgi:hypothetical protein
LSIVVGNDRAFESLIVFSVLQRADYSLGREPMADRISSGLLLAGIGLWAGAL